MKKIFKLTTLLLAVFIFLGTVNAKEITEEEKEALLNKIAPNGVLTIKGEKPENSSEEDYWGSTEVFINEAASRIINNKDIFIMGGCDGKDYTSCSISISNEKEGWYTEPMEVKLVFTSPSKKDSEIVNSLIKKIRRYDWNDDGTSYQISDLNLINFYLTSKGKTLIDSKTRNIATSYSEEMINITKGDKFTFYFSPLAGTSDTSEYLYELAVGPTTINYNGYAYYVGDLAVSLNKVIYIPSSTNDTKEDYIKAAEKRLEDYLGKNNIEITYGGRIEDLQNIVEGNNEELCYNDKLLDHTKTDGNYYNVKIGNETHKFYIVKDDTKLTNPTYLGSDLETDATITSKDSSIPLDTMINVKNITSDNIKKILGTDSYKAYDITLYSNGMETNIEKLDNGKFQVRLPVPSEYEGKDLIVYYINANNEKEEHKVTVKDNYITFETDHFSTYILTELQNNNNDNAIDNPKTLDDTTKYIIYGVIALVGIIVCLIYIKKNKNTK